MAELLLGTDNLGNSIEGPLSTGDAYFFLKQESGLWFIMTAGVYRADGTRPGIFVNEGLDVNGISEVALNQAVVAGAQCPARAAEG